MIRCNCGYEAFSYFPPEQSSTIQMHYIHIVPKASVDRESGYSKVRILHGNYRVSKIGCINCCIVQLVIFVSRGGIPNKDESGQELMVDLNCHKIMAVVTASIGGSLSHCPTCVCLHLGKMTDLVEVILSSDNTDQFYTMAVWDPKTSNQLMGYRGGSACRCIFKKISFDPGFRSFLCLPGL